MMLKNITTKLFGNNKETNMKFNKEGDNTQQVAELMSQLESQTAAVAASTEALAQVTASNVELTSQLASLQEQVAALMAEKNAAAEMAKAQRDSARMAQIKVAVGDAKADALFAATSSLDDAAFAAVVDAMAASVDQEAQKPAFKEAGANAEVDQAALEANSGTLKYVKQIAAKLTAVQA